MARKYPKGGIMNGSELSELIITIASTIVMVVIGIGIAYEAFFKKDKDE